MCHQGNIYMCADGAVVKSIAIEALILGSYYGASINMALNGPIMAFNRALAFLALFFAINDGKKIIFSQF